MLCLISYLGHPHNSVLTAPLLLCRVGKSVRPAARSIRVRASADDKPVDAPVPAVKMAEPKPMPVPTPKAPGVMELMAFDKVGTHYPPTISHVALSLCH